MPLSGYNQAIGGEGEPSRPEEEESSHDQTYP
jgi:hypothetical protein